MNTMDTIVSKFEKLIDIMANLRSENGCPWDREQTFESLRQFLLEETYEVLELIDEGRYAELQFELGDLLLQIIFQSQIANEMKLFDIGDVLENINKKLIHRHPNVFGDVAINSAEEQTINWEKMKRKEGKKSVIDGVPKELSALLRAHRLQGKAATVGFDWEKVEDVWDKVEEELAELREAIAKSDKTGIEEEFGDVLFSFVNLSRFLKVNPEDALRRTIEKFTGRFKLLENQFARKNINLSDITLEEMDAAWNEIKKESNDRS